MLLGRRQEIEQLVENLRCGKHTLVFGTAGVGKTSVLLSATTQLNACFSSELVACYVSDCSNNRKILQGAFAGLPKEMLVLNRSPLSRTTRTEGFLRVQDLRGLFIGLAQHRKICLLLDHLPRLHHKMQHLFELLEPHCTLAFAVNARPYEYELFYWKFCRIELRDLPPKTVLHWIDLELDHLGYRPSLKRRIAQEVMRLTGGHTRSVAQTLAVIQRQAVLLDDPIRVRRMYTDGLMQHLAKQQV